ncbi:hypothetical protein JW898_02130 [Candidatus Woesearchaeota archaeon]|nr:hypothetical protein [Candidatus Woesearchaeota archaeon]
MTPEHIHIGRASKNDLIAYSILQRTFDRDKAAAVLGGISGKYAGISSEATMTDDMKDGFCATVYRTVTAEGGRVEVSELCVHVSPRSGKTVAGVTVRSDPRNLGREAAAYARQCCEELLSELKGN